MLERTVDAVVPESALIAFTAFRRHKRTFGVYPNIVRPKTFSEKVLHRMVFDRRPALTTLQDKYAVRDYVRDRGGSISAMPVPAFVWVEVQPSAVEADRGFEVRGVTEPARRLLSVRSDEGQTLLKRAGY
jgi:hypothetical protein